MSRKISKSDDGVVSASIAIDPDFSKIQSSLRDPEAIDSAAKDLSDYTQKIAQLEKMSNIFSDDDDDADLLGSPAPVGLLPDPTLADALAADALMADDMPVDDVPVGEMLADDVLPDAFPDMPDEAVGLSDAVAPLEDWDQAVMEAQLAGEAEAVLPDMPDLATDTGPETAAEPEALDEPEDEDGDDFWTGRAEDGEEYGGDDDDSPEGDLDATPDADPVEPKDEDLHAELDAEFADSIEEDLVGEAQDFPVLGTEMILRNAVASGMVIRDQNAIAAPVAWENPADDSPDDETGDAEWQVDDVAPEQSFGSEPTFIGVVDETDDRDEGVNLDEVDDLYDEDQDQPEAAIADWELPGAVTEALPETSTEEEMNDAHDENLQDADLSADDMATEEAEAPVPVRRKALMSRVLMGAIVLASVGFGTYTLMTPPAPTHRVTEHVITNDVTPSGLPADVAILEDADPVRQDDLADLRMPTGSEPGADPVTPMQDDEDVLMDIARGVDTNAIGELSDLFLDFPQVEPAVEVQVVEVVATASLADFEALAASVETLNANINDLFDAIEVRDDQIVELRAAIEEMSDRAVRAENLALAQNQVLVRFVAVEEKLDLAEHLIVDLSRRTARVEGVDPADRAAVDARLVRVDERLSALTRDVGLVARMAINGSPQGVAGARTEGSATYDRAPSTMVSPVAAPQNVPNDVRVGDMVNGYGAVLEIFATSGGGRLVVMENGTVVLN